MIIKNKDQFFNVLIFGFQLILILVVGILILTFYRKQSFDILFFAILFLLIILIATVLYSFITLKKQINQCKEIEKQLFNLSQNFEQKIKERTRFFEESEAKVEKILKETERVNKLMVGRELEMINLKKEITDLKNKLNKP